MIKKQLGKLGPPSTDFIYGDFIDESICDGVIDYFNSQDYLIRHEGRTGQLDKSKSDIDSSYKESIDVPVPSQIVTPEIEAYREALKLILHRYHNKFAFSDTGNFGLIQPMQIQWYPPNGGYKVWHTERIGSYTWCVYRHLGFMTYLNDVQDGGTEWFHQKKYVPAKKGYTVIWPSDWTYTHRGRVTDKEKLIITGWWQFV